jgi:hypothetical protein
MPKYQFNHKRRFKNQQLLPKGGMTTALEVVSKSHFDMLFNGEAESIVLHVGIANCLSIDHYNKSVGREVAVKNANAYTFKIMGKRLGGDYRAIHLKCDDLKVVVLLRNFKDIKTGKEFERVYFEEAQKC